MSRGRIAQRVRIYVGCEGESEQSYSKLLGIVAEDVGLHLHLDNDVLQPGGGDPLALVQLAVRRVVWKEGRRGGAFRHRVLFLDRDKFGQDTQRDGRVEPLAQLNKISLIWQNPCHEAFLLRHFEGYSTIQPATSALALMALKRVWPTYDKALPANELAIKIGPAEIRRAGTVDDVFANFLDRIGLLGA